MIKPAATGGGGVIWLMFPSNNPLLREVKVGIQAGTSSTEHRGTTKKPNTKPNKCCTVYSILKKGYLII